MVKVNVSVSRRGKRMTEPMMEKDIRTKVVPFKETKVIFRLIDSMNLDEMLEASKIADMGLRGEKVPAVEAPKVKQYVGAVLRLNKRTSTKPLAKKMQQSLTLQIVKRNKETANMAEAKRLYHELMEEE